MINRRYLRIKVFQALYAHWQGDQASATRLEKELAQGIDRTNELYLSLLMVFGELRHIAEHRMEERRKKHLPTEGDLNPDRRFVDNPIVAGIATDQRLQLECDKRRISWVGHRDLFVAMFKALEESEEYKAYMAGAVSFAADRDLAVWLFNERIANDEALQEVFESRSIFWLEDLDLAASLVKRALENWRPGGSAGELLDALTTDPAEERAFVAGLFRGTIEQSGEHEALIAARASNWEADRIALSDMILMKMALTEVRSFEQIPVKVTLNEYIEIAKAYSTPKSKNFINGVLDKIFLEMRSDGRIRKVGRGLLES